MIVIVDYGVGNLFSLVSSFKKIGEEAIVSNNKEEILKASKVILPGVGAFKDAMEKIKETKMDLVLKEVVKNGIPILGICLGMQMLFEKSYEFGEYEGLGFIKGEVVPIKKVVDESYKIPHIGWNALKFKKPSKLFKYVKENDYVYFVHSYYATNCEEAVTAVTNYQIDLTASVERDNIYGTQFHPEKSGEVGLKILKAFCEIGE